MWFFQRIHFRIVAGAIFLVAAVATIVSVYIQERNKAELRKRAFSELFAETNLRSREISSELQTLGEGVVGLVNAPPVRGIQWKTLLVRELAKPLVSDAHKQHEDFKQEAALEKQRIEKEFETFLEGHPHCLRAEYYFVDRTKEGPPEQLAFRDQKNLARGMPPLLDPDLTKRMTENKTTVSFSRVRTWEADDRSTRKMVLQVGFPVNFATTDNPPGFVVVTLDFELHGSVSGPVSALYLLFLAGEDKRLLLYPRGGYAAAQVLTPGGSERSGVPTIRPQLADG